MPQSLESTEVRRQLTPFYCRANFIFLKYLLHTERLYTYRTYASISAAVAVFWSITSYLKSLRRFASHQLYIKTQCFVSLFSLKSLNFRIGGYTGLM